MSSRKNDRPYRVYRSRPAWVRKFLPKATTPLKKQPKQQNSQAQYSLFKQLKLRFSGRRTVQGATNTGWKTLLRWCLFATAGWLTLSLFLFLISAQLQEFNTKSSTEKALHGAGFPLTSANTILVLGSDRRTKRTAEPGSSTSGPSRSDTMMLIRTGGGKGSRLSIPRDTVVNIPGHGLNKINAAYAFGGAPLAIKTVEQFLDIKINHLVEVNFENFPALIDAMGGVDMKTGCVISNINGGKKNGGFTLRLKKGTHHLNGEDALVLARTRKNACNLREDDLTRARRQQQLFAAMKSRMLSVGTFFRLPWVAWKAPRAIQSDMAGLNLLGLAGGLSIGGSPPARILKPSQIVTLPDGESGLSVSEAERHRAVRRFLTG